MQHHTYNMPQIEYNDGKLIQSSKHQSSKHRSHISSNLDTSSAVINHDHVCPNSSTSRSSKRIRNEESKEKTTPRRKRRTGKDRSNPTSSRSPLICGSSQTACIVQFMSTVLRRHALLYLEQSHFILSQKQQQQQWRNDNKDSLLEEHGSKGGTNVPRKTMKPSFQSYMDIQANKMHWGRLLASHPTSPYLYYRLNHYDRIGNEFIQTRMATLSNTTLAKTTRLAILQDPDTEKIGVI